MESAPRAQMTAEKAREYASNIIETTSAALQAAETYKIVTVDSRQTPDLLERIKKNLELATAWANELEARSKEYKHELART